MDTSTAPRAVRTAPHIAIVGGGIAGLGAAYRLLRDAGDEPLAVTVLEQDSRWGGRIWTVRSGPFTCENGPEAFVANKPTTLELCAELGLTDELIWMNYGGGPISSRYRDGRLTPLPSGIAHICVTDPQRWVDLGLISAAGAARLAAERDVAARIDKDDESIAAFFARRFGDEAWLNLIGPVLRGVASEADELSVLATMPELRPLEARAGSIIRGFEAARERAEADGRVFDVRTPLASPRGGMGRIVDELIGHLAADPRASLRIGVAVESVTDTGDGGFLLRTSEGDVIASGVILALPAPIAARLILELDQELAPLMQAIPFRPAATASFGYRAADLRQREGGAAGRDDGARAGFVKDSQEPGLVSACTWDSFRWLTRTSDDYEALRIFFREEAVDDPARYSDAELVTAARADLRTILGIEAEPIYVQLQRVAPLGLPRFPLGHVERVRQLRALLASHPGLEVAGGYDGSGVTDALEDGYRAARVVRASVAV